MFISDSNPSVRFLQTLEKVFKSKVLLISTHYIRHSADDVLKFVRDFKAKGVLLKCNGWFAHHVYQTLLPAKIPCYRLATTKREVSDVFLVHGENREYLTGICKVQKHMLTLQPLDKVSDKVLWYSPHSVTKEQYQYLKHFNPNVEIYRLRGQYTADQLIEKLVSYTSQCYDIMATVSFDTFIKLFRSGVSLLFAEMGYENEQYVFKRFARVANFSHVEKNLLDKEE